jgi:hypothetical protein
MTDFNPVPAKATDQSIALANRLEHLMERLTPLNALVITLTSGFLLALVAFVFGPGLRVYDTTLLKEPGKEVGFILAPNWFIVYLILLPPYVFLFGHVISITKDFLGEASQPKKGVITNAGDYHLARFSQDGAFTFGRCRSAFAYC